MAIRIPEREVSTSGISGGKLPTNLPEVQTPAVGQGIKLADEIFTRQKKNANQVAVQDADLAMSEAESALFYSADGALSQQGRNAFGVHEPTMEAFDKEVEKISTGLGNDEQRLSFRGLSAVRRRNASGRLEKHIAGETLKFDDQTTEGLLANEQALIAENYGDQEAIDYSMIKQDAIIKDWYARKGIAGEQLTNQLRDNRSNNHKAIVNRMLANGDDEGANTYFKTNDKEIFNDNQLRGNLVSSTLDGKASRLAVTSWDEFAPVDDNAPVEVDKMVEYARTHSEDIDVFKQSVAGIVQRSSLHKNASAERATANKASVWDAYDRQIPIEQIAIMPEYLALSGTDRVKIKADMGKAISALNKVDNDALKLEQEINRQELSDDLEALKKADLDLMLRNKEISQLGFRSLERLRDPQKSASARSAFRMLDDAKTKRIYSKSDTKLNLRKWSEATELLHAFIENNPDDDYTEFASRLMEDVEESYFLDILRFGTPIADRAERERVEALELEAGIVPETVDYSEGQTATHPETGEKMIYKDGVWQII